MRAVVEQSKAYKTFYIFLNFEPQLMSLRHKFTKFQKIFKIY